jgi:eukaryotic-like serine/threonine-protein kinase
MSQRLGKYELLRKLGAGGMGVVFLAEDRLLGRRVALKVLDQKFQGDEAAIRRFLHEARIAAGLTHPNIVVIYDFGTEQATSFIAMEFLEGENLRSLISRRTPMSLARKLIIALQIAKALEHAHRRGVVHRDVKPSNIQVLPTGDVKLMDFGIAKLASAELTGQGVSVGTPNYASPEQVRSLPVTPASDVFSFGLVLYELLTYRRAFTGEDFAALVYRIVYEDPAPYEPQDELIPGSVRELVQRCLAKQAADRYQELQPILRELRAVLAEMSQRRLRSQEPLPSEEIWDEAEENTVKALLARGDTPPDEPRSGAPTPPDTDPDDLTPTMPAPPVEADAAPRPQGVAADRRQTRGAEPPPGAAAEEDAGEGSNSAVTLPLPLEPEADSDEEEPEPAGGLVLGLAGAAVALAAVAGLALWLIGGSRAPESTPPAQPTALDAGSRQDDAGPREDRDFPEPQPTVRPVLELASYESEPPPPIVVESTPTRTPTPRPTPTPSPPPAESPPPTTTPSQTEVPSPPVSPEPVLPTPEAGGPAEEPGAQPTEVAGTPAAHAAEEDLEAPSERRAVREVLRRYVVALQRRDIEAVRRIWPGIGTPRSQALETEFSRIASQDVEIQVQQFTWLPGGGPGPRRAEIRGLLRRTVRPREGEPRSEESEVVIELRLEGEDWQIDGIR